MESFYSEETSSGQASAPFCKINGEIVSLDLIKRFAVAAGAEDAVVRSEPNADGTQKVVLYTSHAELTSRVLFRAASDAGFWPIGIPKQQDIHSDLLPTGKLHIPPRKTTAF